MNNIVSRSYEQLGVKHEPLSLIQPQFETPLPPLQPAVCINKNFFFNKCICKIGHNEKF